MAAKKTEYIDTTNWMLKSKAVKRVLAIEGPKTLMKVSEEFYEAVDKNLSGPGIPPGVSGAEDDRIGTMPVPRRTGTLARALKRTIINPLQHALWMDNNIARYAKYVHDGTHGMKPRRYMMDVVTARKMAWNNWMRYTLLKAIRRVGQ